MKQVTLDKYITHLEHYESNPLLRKVLVKDTTFRKEVEGFYDLQSFTPSRLPFFRFETKPEQASKIGEFPTDLINIVSVFNGQGIDPSKLEYNAVRKDIERWNARSRKAGLCAIGGMFGFTLGAPISIIRLQTGNMGIAIPAGIAGVAGLASIVGGLNYPEPEGTNEEFREYHKLHKAALEAEDFMHTYRTHFIKKTLTASN